MATYAPEVLKWLVDQWEQAIGSAEGSGIVNDSGDRGKTSKHWSRQDNPSGSWAVTHAKDKGGPSDMAAAVDVTHHDDEDMFTVHKRFVALYGDRATDPRAAYVDCFNGWDGTGGPARYDLPAGTVSPTDDSHRWHEHVETFYTFVGTDAESWKAARAVLSVVKGESVEQWLAAEEGDDMGDEQKIQLSRTNNRMFSTTAMNPTINHKAEYGYAAASETNKLVVEVLALKDVVNMIAGKVDIDPAELEAIRAAAYEGAQSGAADAEAIAAAVVAQLEHTGLTDQQQADVEQAVRNVLLTGAQVQS